MSLNPVNVEKDFWVCWLLKQLFTLPALDGWLVFKGGTSLSKCFNLIQRFSEDIDLAVDFERLDYVGDRDPRQDDLSGNQRQRLLAEMMDSCRGYVSGPFMSALADGVRRVIGSDEWTLTLSSSDQNTVEFAYPPALDAGLPYILPHVSLELGTHAEPIPHSPTEIRPFAAEHFGELFDEPVCSVITVVARRTFWEKATILHAEYHRPLESSLPQRYSRHYSDVAAMSRAAVKEEALADLPLLQKVIEHKDRFYHAAWARYTEARPGSFKVMPREERLDVLRRDHQAMHPMFLGDPPRFEDILQDLESLEREINALTSS